MENEVEKQFRKSIKSSEAKSGGHVQEQSLSEGATEVKQADEPLHVVD